MKKLAFIIFAIAAAAIFTFSTAKEAKADWYGYATSIYSPVPTYGNYYYGAPYYYYYSYPYYYGYNTYYPYNYWYNTYRPYFYNNYYRPFYYGNSFRPYFHGGYHRW